MTLGVRTGNDGGGADTILTFEFPIIAIGIPNYDLFGAGTVTVNNTAGDSQNLHGQAGNDNTE